MQLISDYLAKKQHNKQAEQFAQSVFGSFSEIMRVCGYERVNDFAILYGQSLNTTCETIMQVQKDLAELSRLAELNRKLLGQLQMEVAQCCAKSGPNAEAANECQKDDAARAKQPAIDVLQQLFE